ncbi:hypothetical protein MD484_g7020, partial [Candolleomyces efflorescens]
MRTTQEVPELWFGLDKTADLIPKNTLFKLTRRDPANPILRYPGAEALR